MNFKHLKPQHDEFYRRLHPRLVRVVKILDELSGYLFDIFGEHMGKHPEITVTEVFRKAKPNGPKSFHPKFQAVDIRTKDKTAIWKEKILEELRRLSLFDLRVQFALEQRGLRNEHLHIEYDTGDPV